MAQDRDIATIEGQLGLVCTVSNDPISNNLEWPVTTANQPVSTFCGGYPVFVTGGTRDFKFDTSVDSSKAQPTW